MSSVRMCDKCGVIFSENEEDWSTTNGAIQRRRENGTRFTEQVSIDQCSACTTGKQATSPRLPTPAAISAVPSPSSSPSAATAADQAEHELDRVRIAELERRLNEVQYPGAAQAGPPGVTVIPGATDTSQDIPAAPGAF